MVSKRPLFQNLVHRVTSVTGRVPLILIIRSCRGCGKKSLFQDTWITGLIEGGDAKLLVSILLDDP